MREGWARSGCGAHGGRTALHCLGPSRAITSILASPGAFLVRKAQCTYRCVVLPDDTRGPGITRCTRLNAPTGAWCSLTWTAMFVTAHVWSQCTYRCVVLPDEEGSIRPCRVLGLNAPTGAWCSLTWTAMFVTAHVWSQCTYRCVVLPDQVGQVALVCRLESQCTYRCVVLPDGRLYGRSRPSVPCLNAPTGAWCSLTSTPENQLGDRLPSQCTYRCVVLPDRIVLYQGFLLDRLNAPTGAWCSLTPASESGGMTPLRGPGAPPAPGAPLRTGQHRAQSST